MIYTYAQQRVLDRDRLEMCSIIAKSSPDPSSVVGAALYKDDQCMQVAYNSYPSNMTRSMKDDPREERLDRVIHSEMKCLLRGGSHQCLRATLYCTHYSCKDCAKHICAAGIERVVFPAACLRTDFAVRWAQSLEMARTIFDECGVEVTLV